jgi:hypothetical protein
MSLSKDYSVPGVETAFFPFSGKDTKRIGHVEALDQKTVEENLRPNVIAEVNVAGNPWSVTAVLSPYTPLAHVMLLDLSKRYMPDSRYVSDQEGKELMATCQKIVDFQEGLKDSRFINVGYNWSPRSYGESEEKGGFQSLTTKWHIQFWNQPESIKNVKLSSLIEGSRRAILGNKFNRRFGDFINERIVNKKDVFGRYLDVDSTITDNRGIEIPLKESLSKVFSKPEFFSEFLKPLAGDLDEITKDLTESFSTRDNAQIENLIKKEFEGEICGPLAILRQEPRLLPNDERTRRIQLLEKKGYSRKALDLLMNLNKIVKEKTESPKNNWFRNSLGYALVFSQDLINKKTVMRILPGILVEDRGGVVEALGVAITRRGGIDPSQKEKDEEKRVILKELGTRLDNH